MADYKWKPIEDLPGDWTKLASSELGGLAAVWVEHYETIKDSKALKQFNERLRREWAIETGIIENLYYIDRGVTLTLIEKGIEASLIPHGSTDRPAELIVPILRDHEEVVTGLFDFVGQQRQLSTSYIKQLHQALTQHQRTTAAKDNFGTMMEVELLRGDWKKLPNNPTKSDDSVHEYCPPEQVASEMDRLISLHQEHLEKGVPPEVEAAWLHHRFTQIDPFQDGNGRMARTLASLIFLRAGLFPLVIHRDERNEYIDALEVADRSDLNPVVRFFSHAQKKALNKAISLSNNVLSEGDHFENIIKAAANRLKQQELIVFTNTDIIPKLERLAESKLMDIADSLRKHLLPINKDYDAFVYRAFENETFGKPERLNYLNAVKETAKKIGYLPNSSPYASFRVLKIQTSQEYKLVISFHGVGEPYTGIMAVSAFLLLTTPGHWGQLSDSLSRDIFQFTASESKPAVIERFILWLDEVVINGLDHWRQQL